MICPGRTDMFQVTLFDFLAWISYFLVFKGKWSSFGDANHSWLNDGPPRVAVALSRGSMESSVRPGKLLRIIGSDLGSVTTCI